MSITNKLNQIKNAIYGKEVRGAIHDAIKECYDDASVNHDNANMEVKMARGTHNTLNDRLDNVDEIQAQTNAQLSEVDNIVNNTINLTTELKEKSVALKKRGFNFHLGDKNYQVDKHKIDSLVEMFCECGVNSVEIVFYITVNSDFTITEIVDREMIKYASVVLAENGITSDILKIHYSSSSRFENIPANLFLNLKPLLDEIIPSLKKSGLNTVVMCNEKGYMTSIYNYQGSKLFFDAYISYLDQQGLRKSITFASSELFRASDELINRLDSIGLNSYPSLSARTSDFNLIECVENLEFYHVIETVAKKFNKPIYISETGSMDYIYSLSTPEKWNYDENCKIPSNGVVQAMYIEAWLIYLKDKADYIDGFYIWDSTFPGFSPTEQTKNVLKRWWTL